MALEGTYEYECMRAELLGIEKPNYEEFMKNKAEREAAERANLEAQAKKEFQAQTKSFEHTSGKLNELGSILKSTQKKINNLTTPFSTFLKSKIGIPGSSKINDVDVPQADRVEHESDQEEYKEPEEKEYDFSANDKHSFRPGDGNKDLELDHMPLIDDILDKCEKHVIGMEYQNRQMKRFK